MTLASSSLQVPVKENKIRPFNDVSQWPKRTHKPAAVVAWHGVATCCRMSADVSPGPQARVQPEASGGSCSCSSALPLQFCECQTASGFFIDEGAVLLTQHEDDDGGSSDGEADSGCVGWIFRSRLSSSVTYGGSSSRADGGGGGGRSDSSGTGPRNEGGRWIYSAYEERTDAREISEWYDEQRALDDASGRYTARMRRPACSHELCFPLSRCRQLVCCRL